MTEYWKSNPRKFCDYCKCWFADNRPSIEFHERGKNHRENVSKRLSEIAKKGREDYENSLHVNEYMKEMEEAALIAYKNDIGLNPDITGTVISELAKAKNADIVITKKPEVKKPVEAEAGKSWQEARSPDGSSYYYHAETKETRWEAPAEGFVSLKDQKNAPKKVKKKKKKDCDGESSKQSEAAAEETEEVPLQPVGPTQQVKAFSKWKSIEEPVKVDLQLPVVETYDSSNYIDVTARPPPHKFTQRTVTLGETSANVAFKKRKSAPQSFKKNTRMRNTDL